MCVRINSELCRIIVSVHTVACSLYASTHDLHYTCVHGCFASVRLSVCLSVFTDYGVILAEVAHTPHIELPLRQLSSVVLKQYVESHWSQESGKFCEPQVTAEAKRIIKHLLLAILGSEQSKIRAAAVRVVGGAVSSGEGWGVV